MIEPEFKSKPLPVQPLKLLKTDKQGHIDLEHAVVEITKCLNALIKWAYELEMQRGIRRRPKEVVQERRESGK